MDLEMCGGRRVPIHPLPHIRIEAGPPPPPAVRSPATEAGLDWLGESDKGNPRNWSFSSRCFHTAVPAILTFIVILNTSVYVPASADIERDFHVDRLRSTLGISLYTFGTCFGSVLGGTLSEFYGRWPVYVYSFPILLVFTAGAGASQNITEFLVCRFFAGAGGSANYSVGAGTLADCWDLQRHGGLGGFFFVLIPFLGSTLGPMVGAYIMDTYHDWRWTMWVVLIISAPAFAAAICMKETSRSMILLRRQKKGLYEDSPIYSPKTSEKIKVSVTRTLHMMATEPLVLALAIYTGFAFSVILSFFASYPIIFGTVYGFDSKQSSLAFLSLTLGFVIASITFEIMNKTLYKNASKTTSGLPAPEHRLYAALIASIVLPLSLFWFAYTGNKKYHWMIPVMSGLPFSWSALSIFLSSALYLLDAYHPSCAASANAAMGVPRYIFGGIFPIFTIPLYNQLGIERAGVAFAIASVTLMPIPWIFFKYGRVLRMRSKYETRRD